MMGEKKEIRAGLPARMRQWMSGLNGSFSFGYMCKCLEIPQGPVRLYVLRTLQKFVKRGEVKRRLLTAVPPTEEMRQEIIAGYFPGASYRYDHSWHRPSDAPLKKRILKCMRLISFRDPFSVVDLQNLANAPERSYPDKLIKQLLKEKYLSCVGVRNCQGRKGKESLYRVADLDKFRIDLL